MSPQTLSTNSFHNYTHSFVYHLYFVCIFVGVLTNFKKLLCSGNCTIDCTYILTFRP